MRRFRGSFIVVSNVISHGRSIVVAGRLFSILSVLFSSVKALDFSLSVPRVPQL